MNSSRLPTIVDAFDIDDSIGAFVPHGRFRIDGAADGPLAGLRFAAKDLFDIAGRTTGAGNPDWLRTHSPASATSPVVDALLAAGATLVGKTLTDELAYSIHGDNHHYGTPRNSAAPGRVPGGSSSGSAAAVAGGLCDFALGTDTGGSTRVPASYCGIWGLRTTHGLLSCDAMAPLSPAFDTVTWLACDADIFERAGQALLPDRAFDFRRALLPVDVLAQAEDIFHAPARRYHAALRDLLGGADEVPLSTAEELEQWRQTYITASAHDAWQTHRDWIERERPQFGPAVQGRWDMARATGDDAASAARQRQAQVRERVRAWLGADGVAVIPSAASVAPLCDASAQEIDQVRARTFRITSIAGLCGLPQVSIPLKTTDGLPIGVSLLGPAGSDLALIRLAIRLAQAVK
ncbi:amidase [Herbaspirillum sp. alder98]|uniref:amidase n=1 Tax=Herbaspirillum sp. alder98 TaxID=2913096 RepID=UPI001CD8D2CE|nr:amidase [Herbaspirillum sp. alder98]MCA1327126.1 amidase [Herbaspirillum sp. alder98]